MSGEPRGSFASSAASASSSMPGDTFERMQMQHERRLAIKAQMDRMEQAASEAALPSLLFDDKDDDDDPLDLSAADLSHYSASSPSSPSPSETKTKTKDRRAIFRSGRDDAGGAATASDSSRDADASSPTGRRGSGWTFLVPSNWPFGSVARRKRRNDGGGGGGADEETVWFSVGGFHRRGGGGPSADEGRNIAPGWNRSRTDLTIDERHLDVIELEGPGGGGGSKGGGGGGDDGGRRKTGLVCRTWMGRSVESLRRARWGRRILWCSAFAGIMALVLGFAANAAKDGGRASGGDDPPSSSSFPGSERSERYDLVRNRIAANFVSSARDLSDPSTPQRAALDWIVDEDPMSLRPDDEFLLERYGLATLYYSVFVRDRRRRRGRRRRSRDVNDVDGNVGNRTDNGKEEEDDDDDDDDGGRWLSGKGYCSWHGIACHRRPGGGGTKKEDVNYAVKYVVLTERGLSGTLPSEIMMTSTRLEVLDLSDNDLIGTISERIQFWEELEGLYLNDNRMTGTIPHELWTSTSLKELYLGSNEFVGNAFASYATTSESASSVENLVRLEGLDLFNNSFSGTIPEAVGKLNRLKLLYLDSNDFEGRIPSSLGDLRNVVDCRLRDNRLSGPIPTEIGLMTDLSLLYLDSNELTGSVPSSVSKLVHLRELHLYRNRLTSTMPTSLGLLKDLHILYVDDNDLNGTIPTELGGLHHLRSVFLEKNELSGRIPSEIGGLTKLEKLRLRDNSLTGTIPESVCDLAEQYGKLIELYTDCSGVAPKVRCRCCTKCN